MEVPGPSPGVGTKSRKDLGEGWLSVSKVCNPRNLLRVMSLLLFLNTHVSPLSYTQSLTA